MNHLIYLTSENNGESKNVLSFSQDEIADLLDELNMSLVDLPEGVCTPFLKAVSLLTEIKLITKRLNSKS